MKLRKEILFQEGVQKKKNINARRAYNQRKVKNITYEQILNYLLPLSGGTNEKESVKKTIKNVEKLTKQEIKLVIALREILDSSSKKTIDWKRLEKMARKTDSTRKKILNSPLQKQINENPETTKTLYDSIFSNMYKSFWDIMSSLRAFFKKIYQSAYTYQKYIYIASFAAYIIYCWYSQSSSCYGKDELMYFWNFLTGVNVANKAKQKTMQWYSGIYTFSGAMIGPASLAAICAATPAAPFCASTMLLVNFGVTSSMMTGLAGAWVGTEIGDTMGNAVKEQILQQYASYLGDSIKMVLQFVNENKELFGSIAGLITTLKFSKIVLALKEDYHNKNAKIQKEIGKMQEKMYEETVKTFAPNAKIPTISSSIPSLTPIKEKTEKVKEKNKTEKVNEAQCCCIKSNNERCTKKAKNNNLCTQHMKAITRNNGTCTKNGKKPVC